jgi:hypothetical protein
MPCRAHETSFSQLNYRHFLKLCTLYVCRRVERFCHNLGSISKEAVVAPVKVTNAKIYAELSRDPLTFSELVETKMQYLQQTASRPTKRPHNYIYIWLHILDFVKMLRNSYTLNWRCLRIWRRCVQPTILFSNSRIDSMRQAERKNTTGKNYRPIV